MKVKGLWYKKIQNSNKEEQGLKEEEGQSRE